MAVPTSRVAAVELRGFRSVQKEAKIHFADAMLTGIVGPNGMCTSIGYICRNAFGPTLLYRKLVLGGLGWSTWPHVRRQWQINSPPGPLFLLCSPAVPAGCQEPSRSALHRCDTGTEGLAEIMLR